MEFGVLGPLLVRDASGPLTVGSAKQRALLATLLLECVHGAVSAQRLIDELWGQDPPATASKALQVHVSQLRRALGRDGILVTRPAGYQLELDPQAVDVHRFETLLREAERRRTAGDRAGALAPLKDALSMWRGAALADVSLLGPGAAEADRLEGLRAAANETRLEIQLAQGDAESLVPELEALVSRDPYRERVQGLLMLALYRAGRQADALEAYRRARAVLVEELGLEPGPELVRLEAAILTHDESLARPTEAVDPNLTAGPGGRVEAKHRPRMAGVMLGREEELRASLALIARDDVRLVTLTGPGGIGKTRLALELAGRLGGRSHFVELAALSDPDRVMATIAAVVGANGSGPAAVAQAMRGNPEVLFLDNFEQVLAGAPGISGLLREAPGLTAVVTSRAPLRIAGEHELPLPSLASDPAVQLFIDRARERDPGFAPAPDDLRCIAAICQRIDGLPLAIELAAARTRVLAPREMLDRIGRRLDLLSTGRRDAPERHRTLRATVAWSHDLLVPGEQRVLRELAVFRSGWSLGAAEAVVGELVLDALSALVEHSLVVRDGTRFRMLETVRDYAAEQLAAAPDAAEVARRHAHWCVTLAEAAEDGFEGPQQASWFARLDADRDNLRAAASWALGSGETATALRLDGALWRFWLARGAAAEALSVLNSALARDCGDPTVRAKALNAAGVLAGATCDYPAARAAFEEALELAAERGDRRQVAKTSMNLGVIAVYTEDYTTALERYASAGDIWHKLGDARGQSVMLQNQGVVHGLMGNLGLALPLLEQSVELAREVGDEMHVAATLAEWGKALLQHRPSDARVPRLLREALELSTVLGEERQIVECLEVIAAYRLRSDAAAAAHLLGAAATERNRAGMERKPDERPLFERTARELRELLGSEAYEHESARGREMSLDEAVALADGATQG